MPEFVVAISKDRGRWLLDDRAHGLLREPLVFGMERLLDRFAADLHFSGDDFLLSISDEEQPDTQGVLVRQEADADGYWYYSEAYDARGWMGDRGLTRYFPEAPERIFCSARPPSCES